jgi:hypothetical protein
MPHTPPSPICELPLAGDEKTPGRSDYLLMLSWAFALFNNRSVVGSASTIKWNAGKLLVAIDG